LNSAILDHVAAPTKSNVILHERRVRDPLARACMAVVVHSDVGGGSGGSKRTVKILHRTTSLADRREKSSGFGVDVLVCIFATRVLQSFCDISSALKSSIVDLTEALAMGRLLATFNFARAHFAIDATSARAAEGGVMSRAEASRSDRLVALRTGLGVVDSAPRHMSRILTAQEA
jgi:hypothetical protein